MQQVGIEFITKGEKNLISALANADKGQQQLERSSRSLESALKRQVASENAVIAVYLALQKSGMEYSSVLKGLEQNTKMLGQAHQAHINRLMGVDKATKSARSSADVFKAAIKANELATQQSAQATREAAAADAALAREKDRLISKLNPLRASSMLYEKELDDINEATRLGVINDRQRQQSLDALNAEFQAYNAGVQGAAMANNRFAVQGQQAKRQTNQLGVLMQQTGYQVGDFAVQVQSGTNVMVALGQQATQLVGTFGMLAKTTRMIGLFAGLGIAIPILTAIGAAFMRMRDEADETNDSLMSHDKIQEELATAIQNSNLEILKQAKGLGSLKEAFLSSEISTAREELEAYREETERQVAATLALALAEAAQRRAAGITSGATEAELIELAAQANEALLKSRQDGLDALQESYNKLVQIRGIEENRERSQERLNGHLNDMAILFREAQDRIKATEEGLRRSTGHVQTQVNATNEYVNSMADVFTEASNLREELGDAVFDVLRLAGVDMASPLSDAAIEAAKIAVNMGIGFKAALGMSQLQASMRYSGRGEGPLPTGAFVPTQETLDAYNALMNQTTPTATGGGGRATQADPLKQLQDRIALEEELLGKTEAQRQVIQALGVDWQSYDTNAVNAIINSIEAMDELNRKAEQQQQIANVIENSMERAMMSIVDGTMSVKDAFKSMASEIIKELYRIFVVKQITGMIASAVTGGMSGPSAAAVSNAATASGGLYANGGAFQNGNVIPFATGGVVSRATTFPMSDGRTGLMGEAGPEAIMPLKRGKGGKLGVVAEGGGNVVVNNHFNISANGDDSVKRIVRGEIPRITEATKAAVIDAKLRGGSYGRSFG